MFCGKGPVFALNAPKNNYLEEKAFERATINIAGLFVNLALRITESAMEQGLVASRVRFYLMILIMVSRAYLAAGLLGLCLAFSSVLFYGYVVTPMRILARTLSQDAERSLAPTLIEWVQSPQLAPLIVFVFGWFAGVAMVALGWRAGAFAASAAKSPEQET